MGRGSGAGRGRGAIDLDDITLSQAMGAGCCFCILFITSVVLVAVSFATIGASSHATVPIHHIAQRPATRHYEIIDACYSFAGPLEYGCVGINLPWTHWSQRLHIEHASFTAWLHCASILLLQTQI